MGEPRNHVEFLSLVTNFPAPCLERTGGFGRRFAVFVLLLVPVVASLGLSRQTWQLSRGYRLAVAE